MQYIFLLIIIWMLYAIGNYLGHMHRMITKMYWNQFNKRIK